LEISIWEFSFLEFPFGKFQNKFFHFGKGNLTKIYKLKSYSAWLWNNPISKGVKTKWQLVRSGRLHLWDVTKVRPNGIWA